MTDISKERRAALKDWVEHYGGDRFTVNRSELLALLDAADECDRLREAMQNWAAGLAGDLVEAGHHDAIVLRRGEQSFTIDDCTFEPRPLTDAERDEIAGRENR